MPSDDEAGRRALSRSRNHRLDRGLRKIYACRLEGHNQDIKSIRSPGWTVIFHRHIAKTNCRLAPYIRRGYICCCRAANRVGICAIKLINCGTTAPLTDGALTVSYARQSTTRATRYIYIIDCSSEYNSVVGNCGILTTAVSVSWHFGSRFAQRGFRHISNL